MSSLQNFVLIKKFSSAKNKKFQDIVKAAAVRIVLRASWNSPISVKSFISASSLSDFLLEDRREQQLMLKWQRLNLVEAGLASSTQPRDETKPPSPTDAIS